MVITLSNVELPGGRVVALAEIPLACCALETYAFRAACRESLSSPSEVLLLVSGMALAALVGVVLNLLLPPRLEPRTLLEEEERLP